MIINNDNDFYAYNGGDVFQVLANKWCSTNNIYCIVVSYSKYEGKVKIFVNGEKSGESNYSQDLPNNTAPVYVARYSNEYTKMDVGEAFIKKHWWSDERYTKYFNDTKHIYGL